MLYRDSWLHGMLAQERYVKGDYLSRTFANDSATLAFHESQSESLTMRVQFDKTASIRRVNRLHLVPVCFTVSESESNKATC